MLSQEQLQDLLVKDYLNAFLAFSITRTSSINDAEELSQQISFECSKSISKGTLISNVNAYFWSIAHNTYKRYLQSKNNDYVIDNDYCINICDNSSNKEHDMLQLDHYLKLRESLLILSGIYRRVLVYFYYDEMKIKEIATKLKITVEMVKWYLSTGKKKLKEVYFMNKEYGIKSFNPSEFSIYYSGIDFAKVNVWSLFKRKLPGQIVLFCYDNPKTISEISIELGCASCYLEDEINILVDAGVLKEVVKGKFQTNFFIIMKDEVKKIKHLFSEMYEGYIDDLIKVFNEYLPKIKASKVYKQELDDNRYAWLFSDMVADFDSRLLSTSDSDYPQILSCGARALIFAEEEVSSECSGGQTPTDVEGYRLWARDIPKLFNVLKHQSILRNKKYVQIIIDVYNEKINDELIEEYAYLIKEGYLSKINDKLYSNVAYKNKELKEIFSEINEDMNHKLEKESKRVLTLLNKIVASSIPKDLNNYIHGYVITLTKYYAGTIFKEYLLDKGFIKIPKDVERVSLLNYFTNS